MVKSITVLLSDEKHINFKRYCLEKGINMKDALEVAIDLLIKDKMKYKKNE